MVNKEFKAKQYRRALQMFAQSLTDESTMMEIADIYPKWNSKGYSYKSGAIFSYGVNDFNETQLYIVLQDHTSQTNWTPDTTASLYKKVGIDDSGLPIWTQPLGATDAYNVGDKVIHNGVTYESLVDNNVWEPGAAGTETLWKAVE